MPNVSEERLLILHKESKDRVLGMGRRGRTGEEEEEMVVNNNSSANVT